MNVIITGASRGIGRAIAEAFAEDKQGHTLLLCSRTKETLEQFAKELQGRFPRSNIYFMNCDLSYREDVEKFVEWALQQIDKVDVLVNNAGSFIQGNVSDEPDGALETMLKTNLFSAYHISRGFLSQMKKQKSGHIFTLCSIAGLGAYPGGGAYSISKFALNGFTKNLREELKVHGIKVTAVFPGAVYTDSWKSSDVSEERIMKAGDIAKLIYNAANLSPQAVVEEIIVRPQLGDL